MARRDPIQRRADGDDDLQNVVDWEPRSALDRLVYGAYTATLSAARGGLILLAVLILAAQLALGGLGILADPLVGIFVALSVVPALVLAAYIRYADVTTTEPLDLLVITFGLGLLFAGFAGVLNTLLGGLLVSLFRAASATETVTLAALFFLVVGPVEETVKLLAVRLFAYRQPQFNAVVDGAVYGAAAGLGFATIENALYIARVTGTAGADPLLAGGFIATVRALAGPGHVIYSAFAGYYLGLARFNRDYAGPIVLKGLLIAAVLHGLYNTLASTVPEFLAGATPLSTLGAFFAFVVVYDGVLVLALLRKLSTYRAAYRASRSRVPDRSELTEFDP
jgi:RsiW-degrading membrane proteinase PrsW (M82 family)